MNYSAQQISHVYKKVKQEIAEATGKIKAVKLKHAYGDVYIDVNEAFSETGPERLKFKVVGYGGVNFLGNINGKVPTNGLYYKNDQIKSEVELLIRSLDLTQDYKRGAVRYISEQHGTPKPQHAILWMTA